MTFFDRSSRNEFRGNLETHTINGRPSDGLLHFLRSLPGAVFRNSRLQKRRRASVESLEPRALLTTAPFQSHFVALPTEINQFNNGAYQFGLADGSGDTKPDLYAIHLKGTQSNKVEVTRYDGGNNYAGVDYRNKQLAMTVVNESWQFRVHKISNTVMIASINPNDASGFVTVDLMYENQNFSPITHFVTAAPASSNLWDLDFADYNGDLFPDLIGVMKHGASNKTEVHVYSGKDNGAGRYQDALLHAETPLPATGSGYDFLVRNYNGDSVPDVVALKQTGTGTGTTEVHVLDGGSDYSDFVEHIPTGLHETPGNTFQFDMLDYSNLATPLDGKKDLIAFSTFGTGTGKVEVHGYSGEPATVNTTLHSFSPNSVVTATNNLQPGQVAIYEGVAVTIEAVIDGPDGTKVIFSNGSFTVAANVQAGQVAIQTALNLLAGKTITAAEGVTIKTGDVALVTTFNGSVVADLYIESGTLKGSSTVAGDFMAGNETSATPGAVKLAVGNSPGSMNVHQLVLNRTVDVEQQIFGTVPGSQYDQIIASAGVTLNSPRLFLDVQASVPAGAEYVVIRNDSSQAVTGTFVSSVGSALAEGSVVSTNFGGSGLTARISYRGGDGNDVVIVVDGNYTFVSPTNAVANNLRVVNNNGVVQFYVENVLTRARLTAGLAQLIVQGEAGRVDNLRVDFTSGNPIPVGGIQVSSGSDTTDTLTISGGTVDVVTQTIADNLLSIIAVKTGTTTRNITYSKLTKVTDSLTAASRAFNLANQPEIALIADSGTAAVTRLSASNGRTIDFANPASSLTLTFGGATDHVTVNSFGSGFAGALNINAGAGADTLTVSPNMTALSTLNLAAATINLNAATITSTGAQSFTGKVVVGTNSVLTGTNLSFSSTVDGSAGGKALTLNSTSGGTTSLMGSVGSTVPLGSLATNADGTTLLKGSITVSSSTLVLADAVTLQANSVIRNTASQVLLGKSLNGAFAATIMAGSSATIGGAVSGLTTLQLTAPSIVLNGSGVTTTGAQTYSGAVNLGIDQTLAGTSLTFNSTLNASVTGIDVFLNSGSGGTTSFMNSIGNVLPFKSLTTNADGQTVLKGSIAGNASAVTFNDPVTLQASATLSDIGAGTMNFASTLNGAFNLQLASAGTVVFAGMIGGTTPLGTSAGPAINIASTGTTRFSSAVKTVSHIVQQGTAGVVTFIDDVTISAATTDSAFNGTVILDGMKFTSNRGLKFGDAASDQVQLTGSDTTFEIASGLATMNATITGARGFTKSGLGAMLLNTGNSYLGSTTLLAGTLTRSGATGLPLTTYLTLGVGTNFTLQTFDAAIAGIAGSGNLALGTQTLTLSGSGTASLAGVISGTGRIIKSGTGTQGLAGNNTYTGTTEVRGGLLNVTGKIGTTAVAGDVTVQATATLTASSVINARVVGAASSVINVSTAAVMGLATHVTGFGTLGTLNIGSGTVQLLDADTITVGPLTTIAGGTLKVARAFSFATGSTLSGNGAIIAPSGTMSFVGTKLNVGGTQSSTLSLPGFSMDAASTLGIQVGLHKIVASGVVTINSPTLNSTLISNAVPGQDYVVIDNDGTDAIVGKFKGLGQGSQINYGPTRFARSLYYSNVVAVANDFVVRPIKFVASTTNTFPYVSNDVIPSRFSSNSSGQYVQLVTTYLGTSSAVDVRYFNPQGILQYHFALNPDGDFDSISFSDVQMRDDGSYLLAVVGSFGSINGSAGVAGIRLFNFASNGTRIGVSAVVPTNIIFTESSLQLALTANGAGVVTWLESSPDSTTTRVVYQRFGADLSMTTPAVTAVTAFSTSNITQVGLDINVAGDFLITWRAYTGFDDNGNIYRTYGRRFTSSGSAIDLSPLTLVNSQADSSSGIGAGLRSDRGILICYSDYLGTSTSYVRTFIRRLAPNGVLISERTNEASGRVSYNGLGLNLVMNDIDEYLVLRTDVEGDAANGDFDTYRFIAQKFTATDIPIIAPIDLFTPGQAYIYSDTLRMSVLNKDGSFAILYNSNVNSGDSISYKTVTYSEPQDAVVTSLVLSPATTLQLKYDLRSGNSGPLKLKFYKSADPYVDATDQVLTSIDLTSTTDLSKGTHTKSFTIGAAAGQVPIPGSGLPATTVDYYLVAMLDPDDLMFEVDQEVFAQDNQGRVFYHFNHAPVAAGVAAQLTYVENAAVLPVAPLATVTDPDTALAAYKDFNGGSLKLTLTANANVNDRLEITHQGTAAGKIGRSGTSVSYGGTTIGTFSGGSGTTPLEVKLNSAATPAAVQALVRAMTFRTLGEVPSTAARKLTIALNDGDGATGTTTTTINVTSINDIPLLGGFGTGGTYRKDEATGLILASAATVTDVDHTVWTGGQLRVRISTGAAASNRIIVGTGFSVNSSGVVLNGTLAIGTLNSGGGTGTTEFLVTFNANATTTIVTNLIRSLRFKTISGTTGDRLIHFRLTDPAKGLSLEPSVLVKVL